MDFIVKLSLSQGFNSLLTITCQLSKWVYFIPCNKTINSEGTARLYKDNFSSTSTKMTSPPGSLLQNSPTIIRYIQQLATHHSTWPNNITLTLALPPQDPPNLLERRKNVQNYSPNTWQIFIRKLKALWKKRMTRWKSIMTKHTNWKNTKLATKSGSTWKTLIQEDLKRNSISYAKDLSRSQRKSWKPPIALNSPLPRKSQTSSMFLNFGKLSQMNSTKN